MPLGRLNKVCIAFSLGLIAALGAGCVKQQATYVAVDPNTGQQYAVVQPPQPQLAAPRQHAHPGGGVRVLDARAQGGRPAQVGQRTGRVSFSNTSIRRLITSSLASSKRFSFSARRRRRSTILAFSARR